MQEQNINNQLELLCQKAERLNCSHKIQAEQLRVAALRLAVLDRTGTGASKWFQKIRIGSRRLSRERKLISNSGLFDWGFYYAQNEGLSGRICNPVDHYLQAPQNSELNPHPLFDGAWYLKNNPDVKREGVNPLLHFLKYGAKEGRSPHPLFDSKLYWFLYPDVKASGINPLLHYLSVGGMDGFRPHRLFDAQAYLDKFPELRALKMTPLEHYCRYGAWVSFSPHRYFDSDFYISQKPMGLGADKNPLIHFLKNGARSSGDPSENFSVEAYCQSHPEVKASGENPLLHFSSMVDDREILLNQKRPPVFASAVRKSVASNTDELPRVDDDAPWPTQVLQDFLYDEFGLQERTRIVSGMRHFKLPLSPGCISAEAASDDLLQLSATLVAAAATVSPAAAPDVSIIVPVYNQLRFTLACLYSVLAHKTQHTFELIVADDCSSDGTAEFFGRGLPNIRHVRPPTNLGFLRNCNAAAAQARGRVFVFLNNDTYVLPGWLDELVETLDTPGGNIGLAGSKLIFSDGRLQESGGLVFADGAGWNFGRFDDPRKPEYCYHRDSDYVSGASIAIARDFWQSLGGFDECYEKAYFEDTDLAFKVRQAGRRVVVQAQSQLIHFVGVSSGTDITAGVKRYQVINGETFFSRWAGALASHGVADPKNLPVNRGSKGTILVIDARTPTPDRDSGSMDTYQYLRILKSLGYHVIFAPENMAHAGPYSTQLQRMGVQVMYAPFWLSVEEVLAAIGQRLDYVLVYRAPIAQAVYDKVRLHAPKAKLIFDTVDLHFLRMEREAALTGSEERRLAAQRMKGIELDLIRKADATIVLSKFELDLLADLAPDAPVFEIPIVREVPEPSTNGFDQRRDIAFVGGFEHQPNVDAVHWFVAEVMPRLQALGFDGQFVVAGSSMPPDIKTLEGPGVVTRGYVPDLDEFFSHIRVSVAPLRYGAGLKGKVISSLLCGVPVVATSVAVEGGGFIHGTNLLVADEPQDMAEKILAVYLDPVLWNNFAKTGLNHCVECFSVENTTKKITQMLSEISSL